MTTRGRFLGNPKDWRKMHHVKFVKSRGNKPTLEQKTASKAFVVGAQSWNGPGVPLPWDDAGVEQ
jgi:hypothetical protein